MKLNYRDRIILTGLIVVLVWVAGIMLFIKPAIERLQNSQSALDTAKATRSDLQDKVEADKDLPERIVTAYKEVTKMTEDFYDAQETKDVIRMVNELLDADEITDLSMTTSDYDSYTLNPYAYVHTTVSIEIDQQVEQYKNQDPITAETATAATPADPNAVATNPVKNEKGELIPVPATIGCYRINFEFEGKLEDVEKFCEKLQTSNDQKTMVVENLTYTFGKEKNEDGTDKLDEDGKAVVSDTDVEGSMELTMMVVEKLPDPNTLA